MKGIILSDIFFGPGLPEQLVKAAALQTGTTIFGYYVRDPQRYGVVSFDDQGNVLDIEKKPVKP
jgi:glucose-1-phosphate thymidylyltransferase